MVNNEQSDNSENGQKLLTAVERLVASDDDILQLVNKLKADILQTSGEDDAAYLERLGNKIVAVYSTKSAISGGATAIPAIIPGAGTLLSLLGGTLADVALVLKFEVEMALALSALYGHDIRQPKERQLAFLLASISTYEAKSNQSFMIDIAKAETTALWNYGPREISKILLTVLSQIALLYISKSFAKALPVLGISIGAGMNKVLTGKVGKKCINELANRQKWQEVPTEDIIDATYEETTDDHE